MANKKVSAMSFPFSLGKILPGATFASACVPLTQNIQPVQEDNKTLANDAWNEILIQAWPGSPTVVANSGNIYVCSSAAAPDVVGFTNILAVLLAGDTYPRKNEWANLKDISKLFIGADNATDFVICSIGQF